jgi:hypothetical protein
VRRLYTNLVAAGMFVVRMMLLGVMALLQLAVGGAEVHEHGRAAA